MGLNQLNFAGLNKVEVAIERLKTFEPPEGYYLAFSGGKDSTVLYDLAVKSGVKFDAHYHITGIDPPELVQFIKRQYPAVIREMPEKSVWKYILEKGMPRRQARWCCKVLKERGGHDRTVLTGIRWAESVRRSKRGLYEVCRDDGTRKFLHVIIDFTTQEIWQYIKSNKLQYCGLYDEGYKRLGCILCPMKTAKQTQRELVRFPKFAEAWKRACFRYWDKQTKGIIKYKTPEDFWAWWLSRKGETKLNDAQCFMLDN